MPKQISFAARSRLVDLARKGSTTAVLLLCAIHKGFTLTEIAERAGVTRQAVSNWASGAEGRSGNLKQLIKKLEINFLEIESLLSKIFPETQSYEPNSLKLSVVKKSLTTLLIEMLEGASSLDAEENDAAGDSFFHKGFLSKNLKTLFYLAFDEMENGFDLAIIRGAGCNEEAWRVFCEKHIDDQTQEILSDSPLWDLFDKLDGSLSTLCRCYKDLKLELDKVCKGLDLAPASGEYSESEIICGSVSWENYDYDHSDHINYFFYWLSDLDGQKFLNFIFSAIKSRIEFNKQELCIFFHNAINRAYIEEEMDFDDLMNCDGLIFGDWNSENKVNDPSKRLRDLGYISDLENKKVEKKYFEQSDGQSFDWLVFVGITGIAERFEIPKSCTPFAFAALLQSLGYNAKASALSKVNDIYRLTIRW